MGSDDGLAVGAAVGARTGAAVGPAVGAGTGAFVGPLVSVGVGVVGMEVGTAVGAKGSAPSVSRTMATTQPPS